MVAAATLLTLIILSPLYLFHVDGQVLIDIFTFPYDIIPPPFNLIGLPLIALGFLLIVWANYHLLRIGKIGLAAREPMQRPSTLVLTGPYRFSRNPLYLGCMFGALGLVVVWSSLVVLILTLLLYIILRYLFIKREEIILEQEFREDYLEYRKRVRRWL